jgi:putative phage-type endonuclease
MNRQGFIGGSDIASILGVSPWKSAYELWEEKTSGWQQESSEARDKVLNRGKKLEPIVIEMLQEERDVWVLERNQIHTDPEHSFLRSEIDFEYVIDASLTEYEPDAPEAKANIGNGDVKTVHPYAAKEWGEEGTDEFPVYYCAQFQFGLMVTGRQVCMVAALIGADDLRVYEVKRDEELIAHIRKAAVDFWYNNIANRVPPPIQTAEDAAKMLMRFQGFSIEADEPTQRELRIIKGIKDAEKRLIEKRESLELSVKTTLVQAAVDKGVEGDPEKFALVGANGKPLVTWNNQTTNRLSQKRVKDEFPSVYEQCIEPSTFRVLRVK